MKNAVRLPRARMAALVLLNTDYDAKAHGDVSAKWQFIRIAVLKTGKQATPVFVVTPAGFPG